MKTLSENKLLAHTKSIFEVLRIFCDNCAGQNKNLFVLLAALRIIHAKKLFRIEIIFMVSGHSFLPCDQRFGVIEKKVRATDTIHIPQHYIDTIKLATTPPYEVITMKRDNFLDVKSLVNYVTKRATPVSFANACQLVVSCGYMEGYMIKTDYDFQDTPQNTYRCRLMKGKKRYTVQDFNLSSLPLPVKYEQERVLNPQKVKDLQTLAQFMWPVSKNWMLSLVERQKELANLHRVSVPDDELVGSDSENDHHDYDDPEPVVRH